MPQNGSGNKTGFLLLGLSLSLGLVISTLIISGTLKKIRLSDQKISVKGYAEKVIKSDLGVWEGEFSTSAPDLKSAYAKLETDLEKVLQFFRSKGVKRSQVEISSVTTQRQYKMNEQGYATNILEGFVLSQSVTISSNDIELISELSTESTSLIREGIEFNSYSPKYFYTKINDLKIEMLGEASKDARLRAEQLAGNSGGEVGGLLSASQGVFQITPVNSTEVSDYGMYDLSSIEKTIKAVVTIEYSIY